MTVKTTVWEAGEPAESPQVVTRIFNVFSDPVLCSTRCSACARTAIPRAAIPGCVMPGYLAPLCTLPPLFPD